MTAIVLMCAGILGFSSPNDSEYEAASAAAEHQRDIGAHLKLAIWCETHGMDTERQKHLQSALSIDPQNAAAHGMIGLVTYGGRWMSPEQVGEVVQGDESLKAKLARYEDKRRATPETGKRNGNLRSGAKKEGLKPEAMAHLTVATRLDPERTEAWHHLGYQLYHGQWESASKLRRRRRRRSPGKGRPPLAAVYREMEARVGGRKPEARVSPVDSDKHHRFPPCRRSAEYSATACRRNRCSASRCLARSIARRLPMRLRGSRCSESQGR